VIQPAFAGSGFIRKRCTLICPACHADLGSLGCPANAPVLCPRCGQSIAETSIEPARRDLADPSRVQAKLQLTGQPSLTVQAPPERAESASDFDGWSWPLRLTVLGIFLALLAGVGVYLCTGPSQSPSEGQFSSEARFFFALMLEGFVGGQILLVACVAVGRRAGPNSKKPLLWLLGGGLVAALLAFAGMMLAGGFFYGLILRTLPEAVIRENEGAWTWLWWVAVPVLFFATQAAFLFGAPRLLRPEYVHRRPVGLSLAAGTLVLALLGCGLYWAYEELIHPSNLPGMQSPSSPQSTFGAMILPVFAGGWVFWLVVFTFLWRRGPWSVRYRRLYRTVLAGTVLEMVVTRAVDIKVRRRTNCYCDTGTFSALMLGLLVALWCFGPGLAMMFLTRARQRRKLPGFCQQCGLDARQWVGKLCPDCGAVLYRPARAKAAAETGDLSNDL
jgi:hypothetical protein